MFPSVYISDDKQILHLKCTYNEKELAKKAGGRWNHPNKSWDFSYDAKSIQKIAEHFPSLATEIKSLVDSKTAQENNFLDLRKQAVENLPIEYHIENMKMQPYNFQKHGIRCANSIDGGILIADEMGLGKSVQAIAIALNRKKRGARNCLIVCPASVKYNWLNEVKKFTCENAIVIDGTQEERYEKWFSEECFFKIVNYDIVVKDLYYDGTVVKNYADDDKIPDKYKSGKYIIKKEGIGFSIYNEDSRILDYDKILNNGFEIIVSDEIHYIKNHSSLRSRVIKDFKTTYKIGLTGTPIDGKLEELHSIFEFLKPNLFPSRFKFLEKHAVYDFFGAIKSYVKVDEVKEKIMPYYIRRLKSEVLKDLPDKIYKDMYVELDSDAMNEYKKLAKRKHQVTENSQAMVAVIRCRQFCDFPSIIDINKSSAKYDALCEILEEIVKGDRQKVIIFSQYRQVTDLLCKKLKIDYNILNIDGNTDNEDRFELCNRFNNDKNINIMVMTDAGSVGINLTGASYVIHYDDNYSPSVMLQRADRAHRIGQKNTVTVIRFICRDTVEERVRNIIDNKLTINAQVLNEEYSEISVGSMSAMDLVKLL